MSDQKEEQPSAESPEQLSHLKVTEAKTWAAGIPGVIAALSDVFAEAGAVRGLKGLAKMNQKGGFDCSSCAWPDEDGDRSPIAAYCENGAKALAEEATKKKLTADFFARHSVNDLAGLSDLELGKKGRIAFPVYLPKGGTHFLPISYEEGYTKVAEALNGLGTPDEAAFYTSGRLSNEASFMYQLFVREFGTNNMPDCSNMCHESSGVALLETIGFGKGSVTLEDFSHTELIIMMGINPATNMPRMLDNLEKAKDNGAKIIAINPLKEAGLIGFNNPQQVKGVVDSLLNKPATKMADLYLQVRINGDMAVLQAVEKLLFEAEAAHPGTVLDREFIGKNTVGVDGLKAHLAEQSLESLAEASGIPVEQLREAAELIRDRKKIIICWAMGITQQRNGVDTIKEIVNLVLLKGSLGKPGAGLCPVRGHSNVQGNRTMMIWEQPPAWFLDKLKEVFGFEPPREHGVDVVNSIKAIHEGKIKVFFAMGGNFLSATPDTEYTAAAMRKLRLNVNVSTKLNRTHLVHGEEAIIFPTLARSDKDLVDGVEQFVSCENSMGVVQMSKGILKPVSKDLRSENRIICELAKTTLGSRTKVDWDRYAGSYDAVRDLVERCIPGFGQYNRRVREPGGFYLPNGPRAGKFSSRDFGDKMPFTICRVPEIRMEPDEYRMATVRSHDQFNTTIYGMDDRYRGIHGERRVVFMNSSDIAAAGLQAGDKVDLFSYYEGVQRVARLFVVVPYDIPPRCTATYYPETNVLVPIGSVAEKSNTPTSKLVLIKIRKHIPAST
ncbi:MAG TPA: FdhF/YdeP family oxidoreductase [Puia sp.]|jgi:molybdopterin-dependent oxidoreductase alpha subunit|nr:FdhF/YdeP family oxidoreductase [Puia sp.]